MFKNHIQIIFFLFVLTSLNDVSAQNDNIRMNVRLDTESKSLKIHQKITYFNHSKDSLKKLYFHDWNNAFSNKKTALGKRFVENYSKKFFFAKEKDRGTTKINNIAVNYQTTAWERPENNADFIAISLRKKLPPKDSVRIELSYTVKIPNAKYTSYGVDNDTYNLRYWHIVPAVYDNSWQLMHHLDMDDLYQGATDYSVTFLVPEEYHLASNLNLDKKNKNEYVITGTNIHDFQIHLSLKNEFEDFQTDEILVTTNLNTIEIGPSVKKDILNRQLAFLKEHIGSYPHTKLFINQTSYDKNPLYGIDQLPGFLRPFSDSFECDMRVFKSLSQQYIDNCIPPKSRDNTWLRNGIHTYLIMQYIDTFYPEIKLLGNLSKIWGIRSYHLAELNYNDKYAITYQYITRTNHDQNLLMRSDSLTNFNRLIFNRYKAGLALEFLDDFLGDKIVDEAIKNYFTNTSLMNKEEAFEKFISSKSEKDVRWFFDDFLKTNKKIDYSIKKRNTDKDSISLCIKNKRNITVPISLYGLDHEGQIQSKTWHTHIDSSKTIKVPKKRSTRWVLNYEKKIPEINLRNNSETTHWSLLKKPLSIRLLKDIEDPNHTQLFINPKVDYNLYDGFILASTFKNNSLLHKDFEVAVTPAYSFESQSFSGYFKTVYHKYLEDKAINSYRFGIGGSYFHYQPELAYKKLTTFAEIFFKRKNLRSVKNRSASLSYNMLDKEIDLTQNNPSETDSYNIFRLNYVYHNPEIINNFSYSTNLEVASKFSKLSTDIRFRKLTNRNQQFGVRLFAGIFLHNKTTSDYFSYGVNRPHDYLFKYHYYGRAETDGIFSQQIIINDGGFKSQIPIGFANQWITSLNTSIGIWRWLEIYNDVGLVKNKNQSVYFVHDKGIRLNFINNILEVYLPLHSNNGWEIAKPHYEERIRFVFTANFPSIYRFLKRGFL